MNNFSRKLNTFDCLDKRAKESLTAYPGRINNSSLNKRIILRLNRKSIRHRMHDFYPGNLPGSSSIAILGLIATKKTVNYPGPGHVGLNRADNNALSRRCSEA